MVFGEDIIVYLSEFSYAVNLEMVINEYKLSNCVVVEEEVICVVILDVKIIDEVAVFFNVLEE